MKKIFNKEYLLERIKNKKIIKVDSWIYECDGKVVDEHNRIEIWEIHDTWCIFVDANGKKYKLIEIEEE